MKKTKKLLSGGDPEEPFAIPVAHEFGDEDWLFAERIAPIAEELIANYPCFQGLERLSIVYLWKRKGPEKPRRLLGKCQRPTGLLHYFCKADFVIWLAANNCQGLTAWQIEALVFHELKHAGLDDDGPVLVPHDWEGFAEEIERYGLWKRDIEPIAKASAKALTLPFDTVLRDEKPTQRGASDGDSAVI